MVKKSNGKQRSAGTERIKRRIDHEMRMTRVYLDMMKVVGGGGFDKWSADLEKGRKARQLAGSQGFGQRVT